MFLVLGFNAYVLCLVVLVLFLLLWFGVVCLLVVGFDLMLVGCDVVLCVRFVC